MRYRPDIDGLRALSVVGVLIYHLDHTWLPGGFVGVDVFFVISGFVVTASMDGRLKSRFSAFISDFYARRLARIIPALVTTLVITTLLDVLFMPVSWLSDQSEGLGISAYFGLSNWILQKGQETYFTPRLDYNPYLHTWSLGVEEQFYVLAPGLLFFALQPARSKFKSVGFVVLVLLGLASLGFAMYATSRTPAVAFYSVFSRFFELSSGVILYLCSAGHASNTPRRLGGLTGFLGLGLILMSFGLADETHMPWPSSILPVCGVLLFIGGVHPSEGRDPIRQLFSSAPLLWLGKRSYALYLWHWPIDVLFRWTLGLDSIGHRVMAVLLSIMAAAFSTRWIERPLRHAAFLEKRPSGVRVLFFIAVLLAGFWCSHSLFEQRSRFSFSQVSRHQYDWYVLGRMRSLALGLGQCRVEIEKIPLDFGVVRRYEPTNCQHGKSPRTLFVIGDSHALMLLAMLDQASADLGVRVNVLSLEGCTYFDFRTPFSSREPRCRNHFGRLQSYLLSEGQPGDVIMMASLMLTRYVDQNERYPISDMKALLYGSDYHANVRGVLSEIQSTLSAFTDDGLNVILWAPTPIFKSPTFRCVDWFNRHNPICEGGLETPRSELESLREPILTEMRGVSGPNVFIFDVFSILCPEAFCRPIAPNGRPLFFDGDHMSRYANEVIYPDFKALLARLLVKP